VVDEDRGRLMCDAASALAGMHLVPDLEGAVEQAQ
jgi:hypothetical protein